MGYKSGAEVLQRNAHLAYFLFHFFSCWFSLLLAVTQHSAHPFPQLNLQKESLFIVFHILHQ